MNVRELRLVLWLVAVAVGVTGWLGPRRAAGHCDTMDGPVVSAAKAALHKGQVRPVLKWVKKEQEEEVHAAFTKALAVRAKGHEAQELADMYFFETLVRLHRASEGAPYTGLKPAGTDLGPAVAGADKALETGSAEQLVKLVTDAVAAGIRERFARAIERKKHADDSVEAGREFVATYVEFVHFVEGIYDLARAGAVHHAAPVKREPPHPAHVAEHHGH